MTNVISNSAEYHDDDVLATLPRQRVVSRTQDRPTIAAVLISCNDASVIEACLQSVASWVDEIVVVDMYSTDGTREIVKRYTSRLVDHERLSYADPIRNFALAQVTSDWIVMLDPDERLPTPLALELQRIAATQAYDVVQIPFQSVFFGTVAHSPLGDDGMHARFFRAGALFWPPEVHGHPDLSKLRVYVMPTGKPDYWMLHDTWRSVGIVLDKITRYSPRDVEKIQAAGQHFTLKGMIRATLGQFMWRFFGCRAYKDGLVGFITSVYWAIYAFTIQAMLWEAEGRTHQFDKQVQRWGRRTGWLGRLVRGATRGQRKLS